MAYRHCEPAYAAISEATLEGSKRKGGRFNPRGEFGALYLAVDRETAVNEYRRWAAIAPPSAVMPRTLLTLQIDIENVLDLTNAAIRREWHVSKESIASPNWEECQRVARLARDLGYTAIAYPSATGSGTNIVIFELSERAKVVVTQTEPLAVTVDP